MKLFIAIFSTLLVFATSSPTISIKNGTYQGVYNPAYNVNYFLGIPYAQPPLGHLRLALPASLNSSFTGTRNATDLQPACIQFSAATIDRPMSEDCLTLNVYRPSGYERTLLPVLVWIFGGGFVQGSNYDPRYNLTFLVNESLAMGKPIVAVNINYRVNGFGFLDSPVLRSNNATNIGLHDQRLALRWIQENIASFGGDPSKVTIWGQSAGALSVGAHLLAFGGRNDSLFRAAIADSGGPGGVVPPTATSSLQTWNGILNLTGCSNASDTLGCLRSVTTANYTNAVNQTKANYSPVIDGQILETFYSEQLKNGRFIKVPLLTGNNRDEGTEFVGSSPSIGAPATVAYPNDTSFINAAKNLIRNTSVTNTTVAVLSAVYPDIPAIGIPHTYHGRLNATFGAQYKRVAALIGDFQIIRGRRLSAQSWAKQNVSVYSYHFDQWPIGGLSDYTGTTHFTEIQLVFRNLQGNGYLAPWYPSGSEFANQGKGIYTLSTLMSRMWISFVNDLNPNNHGLGRSFDGYPIPEWPTYAANSTDAVEGYGYNLRFGATSTELAIVEPDTWRAEAIAYVNDNSAIFFGN